MNQISESPYDKQFKKSQIKKRMLGNRESISKKIKM